jgi:hypothetical protein
MRDHLLHLNARMLLSFTNVITLVLSSASTLLQMGMGYPQAAASAKLKAVIITTDDYNRFTTRRCVPTVQNKNAEITTTDLHA